MRVLRYTLILPSLLLILTSAANGADGTTRLQIDPKRLHDCELSVPEAGVTEIRTTGRDPYLFAEVTGEPRDIASQFMLSIEYFSTTGAAPLEIFLDPMTRSPASLRDDGLPIAEGWTTHAVDLRPLLSQLKAAPRAIRLDPGTRPGIVIRIRSVTLRRQTDREREAEATERKRRKALDDHERRLTDYLSSQFPASITSVRADEKSIAVEGRLAADIAGASLAEVPIWSDVTDLKSSPTLVPVVAGEGGRFAVTLERHVAMDGRAHDRLLSRWAVAKPEPGRLKLLSAARWVDQVQSPAATPPPMKPWTKKGLGGFRAGPLSGDLDELGIGATTINIPLNTFIDTREGPGRSKFDYAGKTWWIADRAIAGYDRTLLEAARRKVVVSAIV